MTASRGEGCLAPTLIYFSSSAAASPLFHASKEAEKAHGSGVSFDAKRVCERHRHPQGLAVTQRFNPTPAALVETKRAEPGGPGTFSLYGGNPSNSSGYLRCA